MTLSLRPEYTVKTARGKIRRGRGAQVTWRQGSTSSWRFGGWGKGGIWQTLTWQLCRAKVLKGDEFRLKARENVPGPAHGGDATNARVTESPGNGIMNSSFTCVQSRLMSVLPKQKQEGLWLLRKQIKFYRKKREIFQGERPVDLDSEK